MIETLTKFQPLSMSVPYECPNCHKVNYKLDCTYFIIKGISPQSNVSNLLDTSLFESVCIHCFKKHTYFFPVTYVDPKAKCILYLPTPGTEKRACIDEFIKILDGIYSDNELKVTDFKFGNFRNAGFRCRIARNHAELREKADIFENNLDDRVINILKVNIKKEYELKNPGDPVQTVNYLSRSENGSVTFKITTSRDKSAIISCDTYEYRSASKIINHANPDPQANTGFYID